MMMGQQQIVKTQPPLDLQDARVQRMWGHYQLAAVASVERFPAAKALAAGLGQFAHQMHLQVTY